MIWLALLAIPALVILLRLVFPLPPLEPRRVTTAITDTADTRLGRVLAPVAARHPGLTGIVALDDSRDAFAARVMLVRASDISLDLQYYIWHGDIAGTLLLEEVRQAADRGVRVRLLLDDNGTFGLDEVLAALDTHANISVRLFNPFTIRRPKAIGYLMDFFRLNRRMHNKSLTADNQATIVGGRNIGDEYFGASETAEFADLDVLAVGAVVAETSADFDRYWASDAAYPARTILPAVPRDRLLALADQASIRERAPLAQDFAASVAVNVIGALLDGQGVDFTWAPVAMVSDNPGKALGREGDAATMLRRLASLTGIPGESLALVSAYFVPTKSGTRLFSRLARRGVAVSILTNALNATDVAAVHAGYAKHRRALLQAGVKLWELKGPGKPGRGRIKLIGSRSTRGTVARSSGSSLHAKTFTADDRKLFVGSFNFDPRSVHLNTELGFLIDSEPLARRLADVFSGDLAAVAYAVQLRPDGRGLQWVEQTEQGEIIHRSEPGTSVSERVLIAVLERLPIDWLL